MSLTKLLTSSPRSVFPPAVAGITNATSGWGSFTVHLQFYIWTICRQNAYNCTHQQNSGYISLYPALICHIFFILSLLNCQLVGIKVGIMRFLLSFFLIDLCECECDRVTPALKEPQTGLGLVCIALLKSASVCVHVCALAHVCVRFTRRLRWFSGDVPPQLPLYKTVTSNTHIHTLNTKARLHTSLTSTLSLP